MLKLNKIMIFILSLTLLSSCGYFSDDPVEDSDVFKTESLAGGCEIDTDELAQILEKDVEIQINCLEENLDKFAKYVKREDSEAITNKELSSFIRRFFAGHAAIMVGSIKLMFDVSGLVLSDSSTSLKTKNIKPLFQLLRVVNKKLYKLTSLIEAYDNKSDDLTLTSEQVKNELSELVNEMKNLIELASEGKATDLNLKQFISQLHSQFDLDFINLEMVDTVLSLKKLLLGGDRETLTQKEFLAFLEMIPDFGAISFRIFHANEENVGGLSELYSLYKDQIKVLEGFIFSHKRDEIIISRDEVLSLVNSFIDEEGVSVDIKDETVTFSIDDIMKISDSLKSNILGRSKFSEVYTYQEVSNFLRVVESALGFLSVNERYKTVRSNGVNKGRWGSDKDSFLKSVNQFKDEMIYNWANNEYFPTFMRPIPLINDVIELIDEDFKYKDILSDAIGIAKVSLVGGEREYLLQDQLIEILFKLEGISNVAFDYFNADNSNHSDQEIIKLRFQELGIVSGLLDEDGFQHLLTIDELLNIASQVMEDEVLLSYKPTIEELKEKLLGGYRSSLTIRDIKTVLSYLEDFYGQRYFASISYDLYEKELSSKNQIKSLKFEKSHSDFVLFSEAKLKQYKAKFSKMVTKIRLYRTEEGYQYYSDQYVRTKFGLLEHYMIDFAFELLAEALGHKNEEGVYEFNLDEVNALLYTFEPVLKHYGLWSAKPATFGRNTLLLADLFQANSNGSVTVDAMEVSEYGTLALFAIKAADELIEKMNNYCDTYTYNNSTGYRAECYRKQFFNILLNELGLAKYLPKLNQYIKGSSPEEVMEFLVKIEGFAKDYPEPGMPQARRDMVLLIGAMLNIESTFLRYDNNRSNLLEIDELNNGFPVYEEAIINIAKLDEGKRKYAKTIFLFMIKEMKQPTTTDVMLYHYNPFANKNVESKRLNIGALLYNMVMVPTH